MSDNKHKHTCTECGAKWKSNHEESQCPRCPGEKKKQFKEAANKMMGEFAQHQIKKFKEDGMFGNK